MQDHATFERLISGAVTMDDCSQTSTSVNGQRYRLHFARECARARVQSSSMTTMHFTTLAVLTLLSAASLFHGGAYGVLLASVCTALAAEFSYFAVTIHATLFPSDAGVYFLINGCIHDAKGIRKLLSIFIQVCLWLAFVLCGWWTIQLLYLASLAFGCVRKQGCKLSLFEFWKLSFRGFDVI